MRPDYVEQNLGHDTECWVWQKCIQKNGYSRKKWKRQTWG